MRDVKPNSIKPDAPQQISAEFVLEALSQPPTTSNVRLTFDSINEAEALQAPEEQLDQALEEKISEATTAQMPRAESENSTIEEPVQTRTKSLNPVITRGELENDESQSVQTGQLVYSTLLSLMVVLVLLIAVRMIVPSLVESVRYSWYRGQLRAEYEMSGERLRTVSLDSLADVSQLVSKRVGPSVVHINLLHDPDQPTPLSKLLPNSMQNFVEGQGSGFVVGSEGYILTNHHVVDDNGQIEVTLSDGRRLDAFIVGVDPPTDLALLKVNASGLMTIDWGDSEQVVVGSPVWAVGSPFGLQQTVTFGIISGKHRVDLKGTRYEANVKAATYGDLMQSDVALNPGNSGGPLVNSSGEVVGVNAAILGETYRGVSFSIPSKVAQRVAQQLIELGEVERGWLGVKLAEQNDKRRFDEQGRAKPGVVVVGFPENGHSPAAEAGVQVGDIIVSFDSQPVMSQSELMRIIADTPVGGTVELEVLRDDQHKTLSVTLAKRSLEFNR